MDQSFHRYADGIQRHLCCDDTREQQVRAAAILCAQMLHASIARSSIYKAKDPLHIAIPATKQLRSLQERTMMPVTVGTFRRHSTARKPRKTAGRNGWRDPPQREVFRPPRECFERLEAGCVLEGDPVDLGIEWPFIGKMFLAQSGPDLVQFSAI